MTEELRVCGWWRWGDEMAPVSIELKFIGYQKHQVSERVLSKWKSKLFTIGNPSHVQALENPEGRFGEYLDRQLLAKVGSGASDLLIAIVDVPLEDNWFMRPLNERTCVISL